MTRLHTVDLLYLLLICFCFFLFHLKQYLYHFLNASAVEYCNMHICQDQKLLERYDYNIINYVMVINFF